MNVCFATSQYIFLKGGNKIKLKNCLLSSCLQKKKLFSTETFGSFSLCVQCYWLFPL